ncbi:MAG TPA: shikimate dehydrogenase, partial [Elusimicrobiota bacterium]|nr:shikimate dehydrogenase [Elusimicrobiota bacterium]
DGVSSPLPAGARLKRGALAYDLVYRPARTPFLELAAASGARGQDGAAMLVAQAAAAWKIWFDEEVPAAARGRAEAALWGR